MCWPKVDLFLILVFITSCTMQARITDLSQTEVQTSDVSLVYPSFSVTKIFSTILRVSRIESGDLVEIHSNSQCSNLLASGTSTGTTIDLSLTLTYGTYTFYAKKTRPSTGAVSCSTVPLNHQVDYVYGNGFPLGLSPYSAGTYTNTDGQLGQQNAGVTDSYGNIFVIRRTGSKIAKFNSQGAYQFSFGSSGTGSGQFSDPWDIAFDSSQNIYVTDRLNNNVQKFDSNGNFILKWGTTGSANGQFDQPRGLFIDSSNVIYVADYDNDRVQKFDSNGNHLATLSDGANTFFLYDVVADSSGNIYTFGTGGAYKYNSAFVNQGAFGGSGANGMSIDNCGNIYYFSNSAAQVFNSSGTLILTLSTGFPTVSGAAAPTCDSFLVFKWYKAMKYNLSGVQLFE